MAKDEKEKVNQPTGAPIAPGEAAITPSRETLSHQWQKDSPAINTNELAGYNGKNVVQEMAAADKAKDEEPKEKEKIKVSQAEYDRRTQLDVSNPAFINPSLDHHTVA